MHNKLFHECVVETGTKRSENASITNTLNRYRQSKDELYSGIKFKLPKLRHATIFPDAGPSLDQSSTD